MRLNPYHPRALLESSRSRAIHGAALCRRHRILQQAYGAGSHPSCLSRRIVGAVGQRHRRRRPCARGAATATDLHRRELPENASLSAARRQRTRARRAAEGGAARVVGYRLHYSLADYLADLAGDARTHSAASAPNLSKHRTNRLPTARRGAPTHRFTIRQLHNLSTLERGTRNVGND